MSVDFRAVIRSQFLAAHRMLTQCIERCPEERWDDPIGKYAFWHVAYHTLCYVDCYLSPNNDEFIRLVESRASEAFNPQPRGMAELNEEYPSRRFTREELLNYAQYCEGKIERVLREETNETLAGPSGFSWLKFSRIEGHLYNTRHAQHHTGQLAAALRRAGVDTDWVKSG